jgi:hypothetical protein
MTTPERPREARFGFDATGRRRCRAGASLASVRWSLLQWPRTKGAVLRRPPEPRPQRAGDLSGAELAGSGRESREVSRQMKAIADAGIARERQDSLARVNGCGRRPTRRLTEGREAQLSWVL